MWFYEEDPARSEFLTALQTPGTAEHIQWDAPLRWSDYVNRQTAPRTPGVYVFTFEHGTPGFRTFAHNMNPVFELQGDLPTRREAQWFFADSLTQPKGLRGWNYWNRVLYVGKTTDLRQRFYEHKSKAASQRDQNPFYWLLAERPQQVYLRWARCRYFTEEDLISHLQPIYNEVARGYQSGTTLDALRRMIWTPGMAIRWSKFRQNPQQFLTDAAHPGCYLFANYYHRRLEPAGPHPNRNQLAPQSLFGPTASPAVLRVGTAHRLGGRLDDYILADQASQHLPRPTSSSPLHGVPQDFAWLLNQHADQIYLRWVCEFHLEEALIWALNAPFNDTARDLY